MDTCDKSDTHIHTQTNKKNYSLPLYLLVAFDTTWASEGGAEETNACIVQRINEE